MHYTLTDAAYAKEKGSKRAIPLNVRSYSFDEVAKLVAADGSGITTEESRRVLTRLDKVCRQITADGCTFQLGWVHSRLDIEGLLPPGSEHLDPAVNNTVVHLIATGSFKEETAHIPLHYVPHVTGPLVTGLHDTGSRTTDDKLTPNNTARVTGIKLEVTGDHPSVGLDLVNQSTGAAIRVALSAFAVNKPGELIFTLPALPPGVYYLRITTQYSGTAKLLKTPKTFTYGKPLTVAQAPGAEAIDGLDI
jgi:hypothetical protein